MSKDYEILAPDNLDNSFVVITGDFNSRSYKYNKPGLITKMNPFWKLKYFKERAYYYRQYKSEKG